MNRIIALIDLTELSEKVLQQSIALCNHLSAQLILGHKAASEKEKESPALKDQLEAMAKQAQSQGIACSILIWTGDLYSKTPEVIVKSGADLAVLGTHGQRGLKQNLFGSNIWKLVSHLPCSTLVINKNSAVVENGFKNILLPAGPHADFIEKVKQCITLRNSEGQVSLFAIEKPGVSFSSGMLNTIKSTQNYLDEAQVPHRFVETEAEGYSVGYSRDTLKHATQNNYDLIAIMTKVSEENAHFGHIDKENLVLNETGIPVLCAR